MAARPKAMVPQGCISEPHAPVPGPGATKTPAAVFGWSVLQLPMHIPPMHDWPLPHDAPSVTDFPVSMQTATPVEQSVEPTWHSLFGMHAEVGAHELHMPPLQTWLTPQAVPSFACIPVSVHAGGVAVQSRVPVSHGFAMGVHGSLAMHAPHTPFSQTMLPVPHMLPLRTFIPVSLQTETPVEQSVEPTWQTLDGVHVLPAVHAMHVPLLQTSLLPQVVPFLAFIPVSVHWGVPVLQSVVPVWQAFVGVHDAPVMHASPPTPPSPEVASVPPASSPEPTV
jgi:hypothetical protein